MHEEKPENFLRSNWKVHASVFEYPWIIESKFLCLCNAAETSTCKCMQIMNRCKISGWNAVKSKRIVYFVWVLSLKKEREIKFEKVLLHVKISLSKWLCGFNLCTYDSLSSISICVNYWTVNTIESQDERNLSRLLSQ